MAPIRKGDGTPLEIPGVQEVRTGDGRVFFEGGVAIPDSDTYQDYTLGEEPPEPYTTIHDATVVDSEFFVDGQSLLCENGSHSSGFDPHVTSDMVEGQRDTLEMHYYETIDGRGGGMRWLDDSGNEIVSVGTANAEAIVNTENDSWLLIDPSDPEYGAWRRFEITLDWDNQTFDLLWEDIDGNESDQTLSNIDFSENADTVAEAQIGADDRGPENMGDTNGDGITQDFWVDKTTTL